MDEPTSSLTEEEVQKLFVIIRQLKEEGKGVVFISHKLSEIAEIGDRITIMKDGGYVGTYQVADLTTDDMVRLMVGREIKGTYQHKPEEHYEFGDVMFECKNLTRKDGRAKDISFSLRPGRDPRVLGARRRGAQRDDVRHLRRRAQGLGRSVARRQAAHDQEPLPGAAPGVGW